jgi:PPOX class probable F420-dependent enzyme
VRLSLAQCWTFLTAAERGVLSTRNQQDTIDAVPVCFAVVGKSVVSPVDRIKPKETVELARVWNARHTGTATLLCDHWDPDDWSRLWWVRAHLVLRPDPTGELAPLEDALRRKYRQYADTDFDFAHLLVFDVKRLLGWSAAEPDQARPK